MPTSATGHYTTYTGIYIIPLGYRIKPTKSNPSGSAMAIHPRGMVCVLTEEEADRWSNGGEKPDCINHRHVAVSTAVRWHEYPKFNDIVKVRWAGKHALMVEFKESRVWVIKPSGGVSVQQLVNGPAPLDRDLGARRYSGAVPVGGRHGVSKTMCRDNNQAPEKRKHVGVERIDSGGSAGNARRDDARLRGTGGAIDAR